MTRGAFASSMFELADIWTENIDEEEVQAGGNGHGRKLNHSRTFFLCLRRAVTKLVQYTTEKFSYLATQRRPK